MTTSEGAPVQLTLRPYATAGVALTAAGVIAFAPVAPPPPAIQISAPRVVSEAVQLTGAGLGPAGTAIVNAWNSLLPAIDQGVAATEYVLSFLPGLSLIGCQIGDEAGRCPFSNFNIPPAFQFPPESPFFYANVIRPVLNAFVGDLLAPLADFNLTAAIAGISAIGSALVGSATPTATTTGLINFANGEIQYLFGTLFPPILGVTTSPPLLAFTFPTYPPADPPATAQVVGVPLAASPLSATVQAPRTAPTNGTSAGSGAATNGTNAAGVAGTAAATPPANTGIVKSVMVAPGSVKTTSTDSEAGALHKGRSTQPESSPKSTPSKRTKRTSAPHR